MQSSIAEKLLTWYGQNRRHLPWRDQSDPYAIWISEIMLQQTRVESVLPYYEKWIVRFPTVFDLAAAPQQEVLNYWEGLGYYARARNLHQAAKIIVEEYNGELPSDIQTLCELPGIGAYTAGAIASIAFGKDEAALDGNIRRVMSRLFDVAEPIGSTKGERILWALARENLPPGKAGDYNQALMDLGAAICTPTSPNCVSCPLNNLCLAHELGIQDQRPVKKPKKPLPHYTVTAAILRSKGRVLIAQRPPEGLLGGMWEFPGGKTEPGESLAEGLKREICEELGIEIDVGPSFGIYEHAFTHYKISLHAFICRQTDGQLTAREHSDLRWVTPAQMADYPMGKIDRQIATKLQAEENSDPSVEKSS
jgi:A/G-specific adenine glycosylase